MKITKLILISLCVSMLSRTPAFADPPSEGSPYYPKCWPSNHDGHEYNSCSLNNYSCSNSAGYSLRAVILQSIQASGSSSPEDCINKAKKILESKLSKTSKKKLL